MTWNPMRSAPDELFDYIDLSAVDQDAKLINGSREILCREAPSRARQLVARGDVLVSTVRPNLNGVARVPDHLDGATASTGFCVLRARASKSEGGYIFHWVKSPAFVADMVKKATGASYPAVSDRIIFDSRIPLPPLADQRRIAEVLDRAEALRAKRRAALAQLDSLTQSLFLDLFGDPVRNPLGFAKRKISEVVSRLTNGFVGPTRDIYHESGVPYLLARHVKRNRLKFDGQTFVSEAFNRKHSKSMLKAGDVLLVQSGHVGESAVVPPEHEGHNCHAMIVITPRPELITGDFLSQLFSTAALRRAFGGIETGITLAHLNCRDVRELAIPLPPLPLQHEFARRVAAVERLKSAQRAALAELDALFAALQYRAFRGEL